MASKHGLNVSARSRADRVDSGDDFAPPYDREPLAAVLYGVEDVGEVPGRIGRADLGHEIRLSDIDADTRHFVIFASESETPSSLATAAEYQLLNQAGPPP